VVKYHTFLHAIFERAVVDQVIPVNPSRHTMLPKLVKRPKTAITPEQFEEWNRSTGSKKLPERVTPKKKKATKKK